MLKLTSLTLALLLAGCVSYNHPEPKEAKQTLRQVQQEQNALQVPDEVQADLAPSAFPTTTAAPVVNERRFRVSAKDVSAPEFFASLMQDDRYSVAVHPGVSGLITLDLREVTLPEVLQTVAEMYGFDIRRVGNIYHVYPAELKTETFSVNYLMMTRDGQSRTAVNTGAISQSKNNGSTSTGSSGSNNNTNYNSSGTNSSSSTNGTQIDTDTRSDLWVELQKALIGLIGNGEGRVVVTNPQAGLVTIKAMPSELKAVREFLQTSEQHLKRQVILETKILEVKLSEGYEQGVQWDKFNIWNGKALMTASSQVTMPTTSNTIATALGGGASFTLSEGNFNTVVNLLKTQGDVNTLSSPRVTATNNQKAVIKVGNDEYFVTGISSTTQSNTTSSSTSPDIELTPFFSGIALDVTPQIDDDNNVLLHVHPSVIDITEQQKKIDLSGLNGSSTATSSTVTLPMAFSNIRESDTVVQAKSGDIIVIGGLMRTNKEQQVSKVPWLGDLPGVGELFTNKKDVTSKTELVIMMKPQVVNADTWQQQLQRSEQLLEKWYPTQR
ncbi:pilus (MSHA type) biogenesis protein MshL [uncultured Tolumonas sp.]|uniref:pilus (MSHA type) biogenesis protein MshL n=1 Tax=uncultured Tolumonas sp. TaxID=263765 RepID=UPI00293112D4|nr:pilus (MSHA type) biogenesis protein MshL [uncultured Tolumonas sp.]